MDVHGSFHNGRIFFRNKEGAKSHDGKLYGLYRTLGRLLKTTKVVTSDRLKSGSDLRQPPVQDHIGTLQRNPERDFRTLFGGLGTVLVLTVIWLALFIPWPDGVSFIGFDGRPFTELEIDAAPQGRAHQIGMLVLAVLGLTILLCRSPRIARRAELLAGILPYISMLLSLSVALSSLYWILTAALPSTTILGLHGEVFGSFANPSRTFVLAAMAFALLCAPIFAATARRQPMLLWFLAIAYSALLLGAGFFGPVLLDRLVPVEVGYIEAHFDAVIGAKQTLAKGLQDRDFGYTLIFNAAQASVERFTGHFSFATDIRIIQAGNVAFVIATLWAGYLWNPAKPLIALLALALVLPWVHNDSIGLLFPNQAGWRYIAFPLAIIVMRLAHGRAPKEIAAAFGLFGALAVLWNAETGAAVVLALLVRLLAVMERVSMREQSTLFARFLLGAIAGIACVLLFYRLGLGRWPDGASIVLNLLARTQGLARGRPIYVDPLAILVGAYALWFVLRGAAIRRLGPLASRPADRAALGMMILAWGAYYMQQPHPWNLWSYMLPFGLLLGDTLFSVPLPRNWKQTAVRAAVPIVTFAFLVAPIIAAGNYQAVRSIWHAIGLKNAVSSDALLSGVRLSREVADPLRQRLEHLPTIPSGAWIFTGNVYLLPKLSDRRDLVITRSLYWKATLSQFNQLVDQVRSAAPPVLVFDDPATLSNIEFTQRYLLHLQNALVGQYHPEKTISGWWIWRLNCLPGQGNAVTQQAGGCGERQS